MKASDQERLADALAFALRHHGDQKRKATEIPYVSHLLQVAGLVLEFGGTIDQAVAGMLHDVIEDCEEVDEAVLRARFGAEVAQIVQGCSDTDEADTPDNKGPWLLRKRRYIMHLQEADPATKLVSACDKLDNLRSLLNDLEVDGRRTLGRFSATPRQTRWYYEEVRMALGKELPSKLLLELDSLLDRLTSFVAEASPDP